VTVSTNRFRSLAVASVLLLLLMRIASADDVPPTNRDIPFLDRDEIGARWAAMGGACIALVDDGSAVYYNPAGLGKIRRIEVLGTFNRRSLNIDSKWFGDGDQSSVSATRLENVAVSYPFPTYRGSLVLTGSVHRTTSYDQYLDRRAVEDLIEYHDVEERKVTLTAWTGAFSVQLSPNVFVGGEAHFYTGGLEFDDHLYPWGDCPSPGATFSQHADLGGFGGSVGLVYMPHPLFSFGLNARTPQRITLDGTEIYTDDGAGCYQERQGINYDVDLPFSVGLGMAVTPTDLAIAFDVVYTDWHELDFPGMVRDIETGKFLYDATTDIRAGVEYSVPLFPLRLRAGYAYVPLELNLFEVKSQRQKFSLGAGTLVEGALTLDAAWQRTRFERKDPESSYSEERTTDRVILSFAYRF
jgi:hypothetical protein